jgi:hypothetical protein
MRKKPAEIRSQVLDICKNSSAKGDGDLFLLQMPPDLDAQMHSFDLCAQLWATKIRPSHPAALLESSIGINTVASFLLLRIGLVLICRLAEEGKGEILEAGCPERFRRPEHALPGLPNHNLVEALPKCRPRRHTYQRDQNQQDKKRTHNQKQAHGDVP